MYGENFYGGGILFGPVEMTLFAAGTIDGGSLARLAPVVITVAHALAKGDTNITVDPALIGFASASVSGGSGAAAVAIFINPITISGSGAGGSVALASGVVRLVASAPTIVGGSDALAGDSVLWYLPSAATEGGSTAVASGLLWIYPTGLLRGDATAGATAVRIQLTWGDIAGSASTVVGGVLRSMAEGSASGASSLIGEGLPVLVATLASLTGQATITSVPLLIEVRTGALVGDGALDALPILWSLRTADIAGNTSVAFAQSILRLVGAIEATGSATLSTSIALLISAVSLRADGIGQATATSVLTIFRTAVLNGGTTIRDVPWFLRDGDTDAIIASGGAIVYSTDEEGNTVATFVSIPHLTGGGVITLDTRGRVIAGGRFFVTVDPSRARTGGGYAVVGKVVEITEITSVE